MVTVHRWVEIELLLPAMVPCVSPGSVGQRIANVVIGNRHTVIFGQQILPLTASIGVVDGVQNRAHRYYYVLLKVQ